MIAVTQARGVGPGKAYLDKLHTAGKTRTEALRLLRRHLSDSVFAALRADKSANRNATACLAHSTEAAMPQAA